MGMSTTDPVSTIPRRWLGVLVSVPLALCLLSYGLTISTEQIDVNLLHTQNLRSCVARLYKLADEAQAGERAFLLTGNDGYLHALQHANATLPTAIRSCTGTRDGGGSRTSDIARLAVLVQNRVNEANRAVDIKRSQGTDAAIRVMMSDESETTMDEITRRESDLQRKLGDDESAYRDTQRNLTRSSYLIFLFGSLALVGVMAWLHRALLSYLHGRDAATAELQRVNLELENRIEERTRDLTRANEELQQFAYVASHDLQEPLRTITSFTQLLETRYKGRLDEDADEFIGFIVASSRRMTDLINGLLALGRLRKSGQAIVPVSFGELVQEAMVGLQGAIRENGAQIEYSRLPALVVHRLQFAQVLQNLMSNAIKYRREEAPRITIAARRDSTRWIFSVSDNGRGFDQQFAERIFGLFQRLHPHEISGTGMGLSIARRVVERHGGRIWAESKEGVGSTFFFSLPLSLETTHAPEEQLEARIGTES
jgi:signal transduction histidine kinase